MPSSDEVLRNLVDAFNARDFNRAAALVTDDAEFLDVASGESYRGPGGVKEALQKWAGAFSDMRVETLSTIAGERGAAGEFMGRGTHDGPLVSPEAEIPPTGKKLEARFSIVAEVEGGKMTGFREYYDGITLMAQLGLLPEPAETTP